MYSSGVVKKKDLYDRHCRQTLGILQHTMLCSILTPPVEAKRRSRLSRSKMLQRGAPPVVAKRTSRYRGPVAPEDGTGACPARPVECETYSSGVAPEDGTGVGSDYRILSRLFNKTIVFN